MATTRSAGGASRRSRSAKRARPTSPSIECVFCGSKLPDDAAFRAHLVPVHADALQHAEPVRELPSGAMIPDAALADSDLSAAESTEPPEQERARRPVLRLVVMLRR